MISPSTPLNEEARLKELSLLEILDTIPEEEYDQITELASQICEVPVSLVSLIDADRQWFKSALGIDAKETPRDYAFCAHAINTPNEIFEIPDARADPRFRDNPLVTSGPNIVFYTGVPLVTSQGNALGTLCVIDTKPKKLTTFQKKALTTLSNQVIKSLELRKRNLDIKIQNDELKEKNAILRDLAHVVSHDLKSPLNNIIGLSNILSDPDKPSIEMVTKFSMLIKQTANDLKILIDDVMKYSTSEDVLKYKQESVSLNKIVDECKSHYNHLQDIEFDIDLNYHTVTGNPVAWKQIIFNLVSNAVKYNDKPLTSISISSTLSDDNFIHFTVKDNGIGIPEHLHTEVFKPFRTLDSKTRNGENSSGLGLATINKLVKSLKGTIEIQANKPHGAVFSIIVPVSLN